MFQLGCQVFKSKDMRVMIADWNNRIIGGRFSTNENGFMSFSGFVPMNETLAYTFLDHAGVPYIALTCGAIAWEGRLEDLKVRPDGLEFTAFGYWREYGEARIEHYYTYTGYDGWFLYPYISGGSIRPENYEFDNRRDRLMLNLKKNKAIGTAYQGYMGFRNSYSAPLTRVTFDYSLKGDTTTNYAMHTRDHAFGWVSSPWALYGTGSIQTGSVDLTLAAGSVGLTFRMMDTRSSYVHTGETGSHFTMQISNLRVYGDNISGLTVMNGDIVKSIVTAVSGSDNRSVNGDHSLIESGTVDVKDFVAKYESAAALLNRVGYLGNSDNIRRVPAVWDDLKLSFSPLGGGSSKVWLFESADPLFERSIEELATHVWVVYRDEFGLQKRTGTAGDDTLSDQLGIRRVKNARSQASNVSEANRTRDAFLAEVADLKVRAELREISGPFDESGGAVPGWFVRAGDIAIIRNLPPVLGTYVNEARVFQIKQTDYHLDTGTLTIQPGGYLPDIEYLIGRLDVPIIDL